MFSFMRKEPLQSKADGYQTALLNSKLLPGKSNFCKHVMRFQGES